MTAPSELKDVATRDDWREETYRLLKEHGLGVRTTVRTVEDIALVPAFFAELAGEARVRSLSDRKEWIRDQRLVEETPGEIPSADSARRRRPHGTLASAQR